MDTLPTAHTSFRDTAATAYSSFHARGLSLPMTAQQSVMHTAFTTGVFWVIATSRLSVSTLQPSSTNLRFQTRFHHGSPFVPNKEFSNVGDNSSPRLLLFRCAVGSGIC